MSNDNIQPVAIPLDKVSQEEFLMKMRNLFIYRNFDEYALMLGSACLEEKEILERREFFLELAVVITRHLRIIPGLTESGLNLDYLAGNMIETKDELLAEAGRRILAVIDEMRDVAAMYKEKKIENPGAVLVNEPSPECMDFERCLEKYRSDIGSAFNEDIDVNWKFSGELDLLSAMIAEIGSAGTGDGDAILEKWYGQPVKFDEVVAYFFNKFIFETLNAQQFDIAIHFSRICIEIFGPAPAFYAFQAEAQYRKNNYVKAVELIEKLSGMTELTLSMKHLKSLCLLLSGRVEDSRNDLKARLVANNKDVLAAYLLGNILLGQSRIDEAIKAFAYAISFDTENFDMIAALALAYHAAYLPEQTEVCVKKLETLNAAAAKNFKLGVEVYMKCSVEGALASIDGQRLGVCPLKSPKTPDGMHLLEWDLPDGTHKKIEAELRDGYIQKFKYIADENMVDVETSREGIITVFRDGNTHSLPDIISEYMIRDLKSLPVPSIEEILKNI
ncbi:MAG TPA: hypothetical protein PKK26_10775 [Candidatus Wallbacteria bacterium]|nr:hypothetical protein [Candidatus Wallbacteria bacterium]